MNIAIFGASGNIGSRIMQEALQRGHTVTALVRNPSRMSGPDTPGATVTVRAADITDPAIVAEAVRGHDLVISAYAPPADNVDALLDATRSLLDGVKRAGVQRLIAVGGAGSLEVAPGVQLADSPYLPEPWRPIANAHRNSLNIYLDEQQVGWSYAHPAAMIEPGLRTGSFRIGEDKLLTDAEGNSRISMEDFAVAVMDEAEQSAHVRRRFAVAY